MNFKNILKFGQQQLKYYQECMKSLRNKKIFISSQIYRGQKKIPVHIVVELAYKVFGYVQSFRCVGWKI